MTSLLTTNIVGGLGNQLFLLANLYAISLRSSSQQTAAAVVPYVEKIQLSSSVHEPRPTYWQTPLMRNVNRVILDASEAKRQHPQLFAAGEPAVVIPERGADAGPIVFSQQHGNLVGFFQSDRYFSDFKDQVVDTLCPAELLDEARKELLQRYQQQPSQQQQHVVAMHVRRGDYLLLRDTFEIQDHEYYCRALETLFGSLLTSRKFSAVGASNSNSNNQSTASSSSSSSSSFFGSISGHSPLFRVLLFSEDKHYAKILAGALSVKYPTVEATVVADDDNGSSSSPLFSQCPRDVQELLLMSACDDFVIANSSFSWWAAYFGTNSSSSYGSKRVIAPQKWFVGKELPEMSHFYPPGWIAA